MREVFLLCDEMLVYFVIEEYVWVYGYVIVGVCVNVYSIYFG